jgi:hypothetical protein
VHRLTGPADADSKPLVSYLRELHDRQQGIRHLVAIAGDVDVARHYCFGVDSAGRALATVDDAGFFHAFR